MFDKIQKEGVGAILWGEKGNVIMAMSKIENGVDEAYDIEALAVIRALKLTCYNGVSNIVLKGDSMWVVDALKSSGPNMSRQDPLFGEIKDLLNRFNNFEV